jgi:hypothetical protein
VVENHERIERTENGIKYFPLKEVSVFSRFTTWWMTEYGFSNSSLLIKFNSYKSSFLFYSLILKGNKVDLKLDDLWQISKNEQSSALLTEVELVWLHLTRE